MESRLSRHPRRPGCAACPAGGRSGARRRGSIDFYSDSGWRDLLLHVREHRHTLPEIAVLLDELELEFLGFVFDDQVRNDYLAGVPDDPTAVSLAGWDRYAAANPDTFGAMYQFWTRARSAPAVAPAVIQAGTPIDTWPQKSC